MQIETLPVDLLIPYARNARTHSDAQVAQIAGSIREFGFTNPVLIDADGGIIAGHGRVTAARKLGMQEVPCIRLGHLNETQKRAYIIADNKLALNAGWDEAMLALELSALQIEDFDLSLTGFSGAELNGVLGDTGLNEDQGVGDKDTAFNYEQKFSIIVMCESESHQASVYDKLVSDGYQCKVLVN